jgi:hypothetical protein
MGAMPFVVGVVIWLGCIVAGWTLRAWGRELKPRANGRVGRDHRAAWLGTVLLIGAAVVALAAVAYVAAYMSVTRGP